MMPMTMSSSTRVKAFRSRLGTIHIIPKSARACSGSCDAQAVVCEGDIGGEALAGGLVMNAMGDVGEIRHLRPNAMGGIDGLRNGEMRRMFMELQAVEHQHLNILERVE